MKGNQAGKSIEAFFMKNVGCLDDNLSYALMNKVHVARGPVSIFTNGDHYFGNGQGYPTDGR